MAVMSRAPWAWFWFWSLLALALVCSAIWQWHGSGHFPILPILLVPGPLAAAGRAFANARRPSTDRSVGGPLTRRLTIGRSGHGAATC